MGDDYQSDTTRQDVRFLQEVRRGGLIEFEPETWDLMESENEEVVEAAIRALGIAIKSRSFFDEVELVWRNAADYRSSPALESWCSYYRGTRNYDVLRELYEILTTDTYCLELKQSSLMGIFVVWYGKATIELMKLNRRLFGYDTTITPSEFRATVLDLAQGMKIQL